MRGLRARRHEAVLLRPGAARAVAHGKDVVVQRRLQGLPDQQLVDPVGLESVEAGQELGRLDPRRPDDQFGRQQRPVGEEHAVLAHLGHLGAGHHIDAEVLEQRLGGVRQALRQRRQHARSGLDQVELEVAVGADAVESVGEQLADGVVQLGGELDAGGAGADDRHVHLFGAQGRLLRVRADAGVDQRDVEAARVLRRLQLDRVVLDAGRAEVVALATDRDHQRVVGKRSLRGHFAAFVVDVGGEPDLLDLAVDPDHLADAVAEAVPAAVRQVGDLVFGGIHAARSDLVQGRLPDVGPAAVDQRDLCLAAAPELFAEPGRKFETAGAAADDDDAVRRIR